MPGRVATAQSELSPASEQDLEAGSPQFSIAAVKPHSPQPTALHLWPAHLGTESFPTAAQVLQDDGSTDNAMNSRRSSHAGSAAAADERPWRRGWHRCDAETGGSSAFQ